ncbi:hypothetical protein BAE29_06310 [Acidithiobacillus caldus]|uniref:Uncharacterized protein n=2 Tax=Acidithiobacillus caldus TaxID=33059 RepID=A0A1E7YNR6_9PROT|nr:hypothetical protein BAE27_05380 [Acidithiobacillus caldus]OFC39915.1 hypothetical protein BAE29_06310 [Acidithiobacillus caldus]OFC40472.1 hypothetical protein BAE28_00245 [Acidithiobacillus caldus]
MPFHRLVALRLSEWISYFLTVVPPRSRRSFLELLCGCLISPEGWVTRALSSISLRGLWTTYYKLLERGSLRTQGRLEKPHGHSGFDRMAIGRIATE